MITETAFSRQFATPNPATLPPKKPFRHVANDNAKPLPTPEQFATLLAQMLSAYGRVFDGEHDAATEYDAKRTSVIAAYERAHSRSG